jgi:hypothetical protein
VGESRGKGEFLAVRFLVPAEASRKAGRVQRGDRPTRGRDRSPPSARPCALARGGCDADVRRSPTCMCARFFWSWRKKKKEQSHTSRCARQLHLPGLLLYHDARRSKWGGGGLGGVTYDWVNFRAIFEMRISCGASSAMRWCPRETDRRI